MISMAIILLIPWEVSPLVIINPLKNSNFSVDHDANTDIENHIYTSNGENSSIKEISLNIKNWENKFGPNFNTSVTLISSYIACPPSSKLIQEKCYSTLNFEYMLNITHWNISLAQKYCELMADGQLAGKPSGRWDTWTTSLQMTDDKYYFVNISKTKRGWFWSNGDPVVEWDTGQPSGDGGSNACATVWSVSNKLSETLCSGEYGEILALGVICEVPPRGICNGNICECIKGYYGTSCQYKCSDDCILPYICSSVGNKSVCKCHEAYKESNNECIPLVICPNNFIEVLGHCYRCMDDNKYWQDAQTSCKNSSGGALAEPPLSLWEHWLFELPITDYQMYWVNLQKTQNGWYWPSGKKVQQWGPNQPDGEAARDACAALSTMNYKLVEVFCSNTSYKYICEAPKSGCVSGYFGRNCNHGFSLYIWLTIAFLIIIIPFIALLFYMRLQHLKYKEDVEYKMGNKPRGHCIIMYTREDDIYISQVDFTPHDQQNLQLHEGQIIEVISPTTHKDILYGKPYGIESAKEGYFSKKHVKQSQYGLADADLCSDLWSDLDFTVHKMEVKNVEDFKTKLFNCHEEISAESKPQYCFSFIFIGHGYTENKTELIELKGCIDEYNKYSWDKYDILGDHFGENSFFNNGFLNDDESQSQSDNNEKHCIANYKYSNNIEKVDLSTNLGQDDIDLQSNDEIESVGSVGFPVRLIYEIFTAQQCPKLAGVPKLFYIQACRGDKIDTPMHKVDENYQMFRHETAGRAFITNTILDDQINLTPDTLASYSDLYVFCSSFTGYFSYFSRREGKSFFIKEICEIYRRDHKKHTLSEMNTKVKDRISKMNISIGVNSEKQIPTVSVDTLRKILKFK